MSVQRGFFITFEGGEGAGKSTQIASLASALRDLGLEVVVTREPGGSKGAEAVRHVLLSGAAEEFGTSMEAMLFAAARNDHVNMIIRPALERGAIVLCDRFFDSSRVYQGATGDLSSDFIEVLQRVAVDGVVPDLTLIFDIDASKGLARAKRRAGDDVALDRFEKEELATHERRREAFLDIALHDRERCRVVNADQSQERVRDDVWHFVQDLFVRHNVNLGVAQ